MQPAIYRSPSRSLSPPPRQNKTMLQRQYREKEGESFSILRNVIKELAGEKPQTRQEILRKATELLQFLAAEVRRLNQQATTDHTLPRRSELSPPGTAIPGPSTAIAGRSHGNTMHMDYVPPSQWPSLGNCEFGPAALHPGATTSHNRVYGYVADPNPSTSAPMPEIDDLCRGIGEQSFSHYNHHSGSHSNYSGENRG
ncbi:hypothetical protein BS17DRAFT_815416 [Gyrodon lividus]|nr:hypothetical protein BS17DRAFT_815416 [Gyrodon lividus]